MRNKCIEIYELDPAHFIICTSISMARFVEKDKLELLTDNDLLMMVEKKIRDRICHVIHRYSKANNKYINNFDKINKS